jgi:hypothetical protein
LDLDHNADPDKENTYGFAGYIHQQLNGLYIQREAAIKAPLTYLRTKGEFHIFKAKKVINNREEYAGLSGAPILDFTGRIVALACMVRPGTNMIYGFSISDCIYLLDLAISAGQL